MLNVVFFIVKLSVPMLNDIVLSVVAPFQASLILDAKTLSEEPTRVGYRLKDSIIYKKHSSLLGHC